MACGFCATGQAGFTRHLTVGEIVEQVVRASQRARRLERRVSNIVFMGMGEPMANLDAVWASVERIHGDLGLSARHLTISTVGIVPGIRRLADLPLPVNLAVSLHSANDVDRNELVPINRKHPISELLDACWRYAEEYYGRFITFEYVMLRGVNDSLEHADELAALLKGKPAKINLIPFNPFPGTEYRCSPESRILEFQSIVMAGGLIATVRKTRGEDIDAACGQLVGKVLDRTRRSRMLREQTTG